MHYRNFFLAVTAFLSIAAYGQTKSNLTNSNGYEITGYLKGLEDGDKIAMLLCLPETIRFERRDSGYVKDGVFHISGIVPDSGPRFYWMTFKGKQQIHPLCIAIANHEQIVLHCKEDVSKYQNRFINDYVAVDGAPYHNSSMKLLAAWFFYDRTLIDLRSYAGKIVDSLGFDGPLLTGVFESMNKVNQAFYSDVFTDKPNQTEQAITMAHVMHVEGIAYTSKHASYLADAYKALPESEKSGAYGKLLGVWASLCVGQTMPGLDLHYPGTDGTSLSIKDMLSKGKITLINFWGTNSPLTKRAHDELRVMYKLYHEKGLNILAISSDDYADAWKEYLDQEKYPWYNALDKKGHIVDTVYHEYGNNSDKLRNVTNVLLDSQGKIIAWDADGVELQYYLWKYLEKSN